MAGKGGLITRRISSSRLVMAGVVLMTVLGAIGFAIGRSDDSLRRLVHAGSSPSPTTKRGSVTLSGRAAKAAALLGGRPVASTVVAAHTPLPKHVYAPYYETFLAPDTPSITAEAVASGVRYFSLAFLQAAKRGSCSIDWNSNSSQRLSSYNSDIASLRALGGDVIPTFGGQAADTGGTEIADSCTNVQAIAADYESVIKTLGVTRLNMDVEDNALNNTAGIDRRNKAIAIVERWAAAQKPPIPLQIEYSLTAKQHGFDPNADAVLRNAAANGVTVHTVDLIVFNYFTPGEGVVNMGRAAITAATGAHAQLQAIFPKLTSSQVWAMEGLTILPGIDDYPPKTEVTSLHDATTLLNFAQANSMNLLAIWALQRDNGGCPGTLDSNTCSGLSQSTWGFSHMLEPFTGVLAAPAVSQTPAAPSPAPTATVSPGPVSTGTAVAAPQLHVAGNRLVNAQGQRVVLHGVDRSGGEYACVQGWGLWDGPMDQASITAMKAWHINAVRVPLNEGCWNGESYVSARYRGLVYQRAVQAYVRLLNSNGMVAILDLHWTDGAYSGPSADCSSQRAVCQKPMPDAGQSIAFWSSVARTFRGNDAVIFDLFNEPFPDQAPGESEAPAWQCWRNGGAACRGIGYQVAGMQALVRAIRATGANNVLMLGGLGWASDMTGWLAHLPTDPDHNLAVSWHSYNFSGCATLRCWNGQIAPVLRRVPLIAGEIGQSGCSDTYIDPLMTWLDGHSASYIAWAWNAAGCSSGPSLITNYGGQPTAYGAGYRSHLRSSG